MERLPVGSEVGLKERVPLHGSCSDYLVRSFDHVKWHPMEHEHAEVGRAPIEPARLRSAGRAQKLGVMSSVQRHPYAHLVEVWADLPAWRLYRAVRRSYSGAYVGFSRVLSKSDHTRAMCAP